MFEVDSKIDYELLPKDSDWLKEIDVHMFKEQFTPAMQKVEAKLKDADPSKQAAAYYAKAKIAHVQGQQYEANVAAEEALTKFRTLGVGMGEAIALHTLAQIGLDAKNSENSRQSESFNDALKNATEALTQVQRAHSGKGEAAVLNTLAKIYYLKRDPEEALKQADLAQQTFKGMDETLGEAKALTTKATIFLMTENFDQAYSKSQEAAKLCKSVKTPNARAQEANTLLISSAAAIPNHQINDAVTAAKAAKKLFTDLEGECGIAKSLRALAFCYLMSGNIEEAVKCTEEALPLIQKHSNKFLLASMLSVGALVYRNKLVGDRTAGIEPKTLHATEQKALKMAKDALACYQDLGDERAIGLVRIDLAQTFIACGNTSEAYQEAKKSQETFERLGEKIGEGIASLTLSELQFNMGRQNEAIDSAKKAQYLLSDFEGIKEADKLLGVMQPGQNQKGSIGKWSKVPMDIYKEGRSTGGLSLSTYSQMLLATIRSPYHDGDCIFDEESITQKGNYLGVNFPCLRTWTKQSPATAAAQQPTPTQIQVQTRPQLPTATPTQEPVQRKRFGMSLERQVDINTRVDTDRFPIIGTLPDEPSIIGSDDILGGRVMGCPEELHNRMVALALRGEIPITRPATREKFVSPKNRFSFSGSPQWRDAVKMGYIHPDINPPAGTKWMKAAFGWKLIEVTPAPAEQSAPVAACRIVHSSEPLGSMTLHATLQAACPNMKDNDIITVRRKLKKIQIENTMGLLEFFQNEKPEDLNARLTAVDEKGFKEDTLHALGEYCGSMQ